jgi:hypothetical protein
MERLMAQTAAAKKPRTSIEAVPQLATLPERVAVLEVKVNNIDEKMDDLKQDLCDNHENIISTLKEMRDTSVAQHTDMANKIKELEGFKNKWARYIMVGLAFAAGAGWIGSPNFASILKFLGL